MRLEDFREKLEKHFELFGEPSITLETSVEEKRRIVEENKNKKAMIKIEDFPNISILGRLEPKNGISFGLKATEPQVEMNYPEIVSYKDLLELRICYSSPIHSNNHKR